MQDMLQEDENTNKDMEEKRLFALVMNVLQMQIVRLTRRLPSSSTARRCVEYTSQQTQK